jgi:hypothetical protein
MEKKLYVVFKYLSRSLLQKGVAVGGVKSTHLTTTLFPADPGIFKDDVTVYFLHRWFLHGQNVEKELVFIVLQCLLLCPEMQCRQTEMSVLFGK